LKAYARGYPIEIVEIEKALRDNGANTYLIALVIAS
jgi:hypothetical protein